MTNQETLKLALDALENHAGNYKLDDAGCDRHEKAIKALEEALAKQEQGEPVAYVVWGDNNVPALTFTKPAKTYVFDALYTTPQPKQEQGEPVATDWNAVHEKLKLVWYRELSADEGLDEIQDLINTTPQQRDSSATPLTWVGLTEKDKQTAFDDTQEGGGFWEFADAIEAKLKEKNTP
jgi:hypothetical protein